MAIRYVLSKPTLSDKMKIFVINLKDSIERRAYIQSLFEPYSNIDLTFTAAVDGRYLTDIQLQKIFKQTQSYKIYGRFLGGGEVGCTLSHRKCYSALLNSSRESALVVEDDLVLRTDDFASYLLKIESYMATIKDPHILLLSGDYWYTTIRRLSNGLSLANVREAVCTHAYVINRQAAEIILSSEPCYLADDWFHIKKLGIHISALFPHIADQNRKDWTTDISDAYTGTIRRNLSVGKMVHSYYRAIIKRILKYSGHFESKTFLQ